MENKFKMGFVFLFMVLFSFSVSGLTFEPEVIINSSGTANTTSFFINSSIDNLTINSGSLIVDGLAEPVNVYAHFIDQLTNATLDNKTIIINYPDGSTETQITNTEGRITFGLLYNDLIQFGDYEFIYTNLDGFVTPTTFVGTVSNTTYNETFSLYKGRLNISIYNQVDNTLINGTNVSVSFISDEGQFTVITSTGYLERDNITAGEYEIEFKSTPYETSSYFVSVSDNSVQSLNAYLLPTGAAETILTFKDSNTETIIEGVDLSIEQIINDEWVLINVLTSDISGRVVFNYQETAKYRFSTSGSGYTDKVFTLDPIIFTSYNIWLDKEAEEQEDQDYSGVNIKQYPSAFYNDQNNTVTLYFISPDGAFQNYGFNATYKNTTISKSGVNAIGEVLTDVLYIENAIIGDQVIINYYYQLSSGELKTYTLPYTILDLDAAGTFAYNKGETYGLGLFERTLIAVLIVIGVAGAAYLFGGLLAAGLLAMLVFGYITYIGFLSGWVTIPTMIIIFIVTSWGATK